MIKVLGFLGFIAASVYLAATQTGLDKYAEVVFTIMGLN